MTEIDELLSIIENPTRRRILEYLTREPSYPLQLSKELGISQQAIMKNLTLMEQTGMLMSHPEVSNMGPNRIVYAPKQQFTMMIDLHDNMFTARLISSDENGDTDIHVEGTQDALERLKELDSKIEELDHERSALLNERNMLMSSIKKDIRNVANEEERKELYRKLDEATNNNREEKED